jgi:hypothetical protein
MIVVSPQDRGCRQRDITKLLIGTIRINTEGQDRTIETDG